MQKHVDIDKAIERKYPEQVVLVTSRGKDGKPNVMAVGWICVASGDPLMFILGIDEDSHTFELIRETKEFVVAYPHEFMKDETLIAGSCHGDEVTRARAARLGALAFVEKHQPAAELLAALVAVATVQTRGDKTPLRLGEITHPSQVASSAAPATGRL